MGVIHLVECLGFEPRVARSHRLKASKAWSRVESMWLDVSVVSAFSWCISLLLSKPTKHSAWKANSRLDYEKYPCFFGTWSCIAVFILQVRKMSLAFAGESGLYLHTIIPNIYLIILLLSRRFFSLSLVLSYFTIKTLCTLLVLSMRLTYFAHRFLCLEYYPTFFGCYKLWNPTYWGFHILLLVFLC